MRKTWIWLLAFAAVWLALRVFWLDGDPGVPALWEYGYNATDEGYYMGAGKDKFLWGAFCDFTRNESFTYGYSPLTHWLSYAAYRVFGLSDWCWRLPFVLLYFIAWMCSFSYVAKRCGNVQAFVWCTCLSLMPVMVVYERTACNDLTIAALGVIAFCVASGRGLWCIFAAAVIAGAITLIKPSVWVVLPIVAAGILSERKSRSVWLDLGLFAGASVLAVVMWKSLALLSVLPEAARHGLSPAEIIRRTTTHNALPSLLDIVQFLRGFSSFPRDVCFKALSAVAAFLAVVPLSMAARAVIARRWNARLVFYLALLAYTAGISVNNTICLHYYHPALLLLPILWAQVWQDMEELPAPDVSRKAVWVLIAVAIVGTVVASVCVMSSLISPQEAIAYFSTISNLPQKIVWGMNGACVVSVAIAVVVALGVVRGLHSLKREGVFWFVGAFAAASVAFSTAAIPCVARYVRLTPSDYTLPMSLTLAGGLVWMIAAFAADGKLRRWAVAGFVPVTVALCFAFTPSWRAAAVELLRPASHVQREVAEEVAKRLPPEAVVIGERSTQVLMGKPFRTATTMPACDPIPIVRQLFAKDRQAPVYALLDSQNAYNLQHFQKHQDEFRLDLLKKFQLPSFAAGKPADVFLCRVVRK